MIENPTHPDLAYHLRRLLEVVKGACAEEGRWGWLAGPVALLTWIRTRRERREAAMAMEAVKGLVEALLGLLEDFRAGKLPTQTTPDPPPQPSPSWGEGVEAEPQVHEAGETVNGAVAYPSPQPSPTRGEGEESAPTPTLPRPKAGEEEVTRRPAEDLAPLRFSASSAVEILERREAQRNCRAADVSMIAEQPTLRTKCAASEAGVIPRALAPWARPPPDGRFFEKSGWAQWRSCAHYVAIS
jgi:hypothetical protein